MQFGLRNIQYKVSMTAGDFVAYDRCSQVIL